MTARSPNNERWRKRFVLKNKGKTDLPPHEDVVAAFQGVVVKVVRVEAFCIFVKRLKLALEGNTQEAEAFIYLRFWKSMGSRPKNKKQPTALTAPSK